MALHHYSPRLKTIFILQNNLQTIITPNLAFPGRHTSFTTHLRPFPADARPSSIYSWPFPADTRFKPFKLTKVDESREDFGEPSSAHSSPSTRSDHETPGPSAPISGRHTRAVGALPSVHADWQTLAGEF